MLRGGASERPDRRLISTGPMRLPGPGLVDKIGTVLADKVHDAQARFTQTNEEARAQAIRAKNA